MKRESEDMQNQGSTADLKMIKKVILKSRYLDLLLVFLVAMVSGLLLAVSASAQPEPVDISSLGANPFDAGSSGLNQPPNLISLIPNEISPQVAGTAVVWTAKSLDPEGDTVLYEFWLNGPSTGNEWKMVRDWSDDSTWRWSTSSADVGNNQVRVWIRDGNHKGTDSFDNEGIERYVITEPEQAPGQGIVPIETPQIQQPPIQQPAGFQLPNQQGQQEQGQGNVPAFGRQQAAPTGAIPAETLTQVNEPPEIRSLVPSQTSPQELGATVVWTAEAFDQENDQILYRFFLNSQPVTQWQQQNQWTWTTTEASVGDNQVEVRIIDGKHAGQDGSDDRESVPFTISLPNQKPAITDFSADKQSPQEAGAVIVWTIEAADPENDPILYQFRLNDRIVRDWSPDNRWTWTTSEESVGEARVEARIVDTKHASADGFDDSRQVSFTITAPNQKPFVTRFEADKQSPQEAGAVITWTAEAADPENDQIFYRFFLNSQPVTQWQPQNQWTWTTDQGSVGDDQVQVAIRDGNHAGPNEFDDSKEATFTITTPNQPPTIITLSADNPSPQEAGTTVVWTAEATDPEDDPISYRFFLNGQPVTQWQPQNQWTWMTTEANIGEAQVEVRVIDGKHADQNGFDDSKSASFTIVAPNQKPAITRLSADKESPQEAGAAITWTADATDPENDPISYRFFLNGQPATDWQPQNQWTWTTTEANVGDNRVEVRIIDGKHAGQDSSDDSESASFVISPVNQKPTLTGLSSDKSGPQEAGSVITWTAEAADKENDPILYRFFLGGQSATEWQPQNQWTWTTTDANVGDNQIEVRIIDGKHAGQDGFDDSKSASFTITAPNQPPAITSFVPDKESPQEAGAIITWTVEAADPENDPISYRFFLGGQPVTEWQPQNQWVWTTTETNVGDNQVEVRIIDGKHAGQDGFDGSKTAAFTINAPAPVQEAALPAVPEVVNETPVVTDLIPDKSSPQEIGAVITWTAQASDPENDQILYKFLLNGTDATDWQTQNQWVWTASTAGTSQIEVRIRDGQHAGPDSSDSNRTAEFTINAPAPAPEEVVPAVPARANETPVIISLAADKPSPQDIGAVITWTAEASDPENDQVLYKFLLNGTDATDWQTQNQWVWTASTAGTSQIEVRIRDGQHAGPDGYDNRSTAEFAINAPAPAPVTTVPEVVVSENATPEIPIPENVTPEIPTQENVTPIVNATVPVTPAPEVEIPPAPENITVPVIPENVTPELPANATAAVAAPAPAVEENQAPTLNTLTPDKPSPQISGTAITWDVNATDPDNDTILYRFFLNGPATGGSWQPKTGWTGDSAWTWTTSAADVGENQVRVGIRDGKHAGEDSSDAEQTAYFTITAVSRNISGTKFNDRNGNGLKDNGEETLGGWTIQLQKPDGGTVSTITGDDGSYRFENLALGTYTLTETLQAGWNTTAPQGGSYSVDLADADVTAKDFGNRLTSYSISGMKFDDLNNNGANDGEPGLSGWTIKLVKPDGTQATATTGADGSYKFDNLQPGSYLVSEVEQSGWVRTAPKEGSYSVDLKDADVAARDFGNHGTWAISGTKFSDANGDGVRGSDEPGLPGWTIQLVSGGNVINATTTGQDGSYSFRNLAPGSYTVSEVAQDGWVQTAPQGTYTVDLKDADVTGRDFGNRANLSITGVKYYDANENGVQDQDEPGLPGQEVKLVLDSKEIASVTTGQDGSYTFSNLVPGTYEVDDPVLVTVTTKVVVVVKVPIITSFSISGVKFNDLNSDGIKQTTEPGIDNWDIDLVYITPGPAPDILLARKSTDSNGAYVFHNLPPGTYKVSEVARQGWTPTTPAEITVNIPGSASNRNFGNRLVSPPANKGSIVGIKFNDLNKNGNRNSGEPGLQGWTVQLKNGSTQNLITTTTTGTDGSYAFLNLTPGPYIVAEVNQAGWTQSKPAVGPGGAVYSFTLAAGETKQGIDFGNYLNNSPPVNPTLVPSPASPQKVGKSIVWTAGATDPDGDTLQFRFLLKGPSTGNIFVEQRGWSTTNTWTWNTAGYLPGTYQVEVWIRDGLHQGPSNFDVKKTVSFTLNSGNLPPVVKVLFADRPAPQFAGAWIKWTALASDPEGDQIQYRYFLRGPSTGGFWIDQTGWSKNNRWVWRTTPLDVGFSQVLVAVRDGNHAGPAGSDDYDIAGYAIIIPNQPPVITSLAGSAPSPQPVGATVGWKATAFDPEGNPVFFRYWLKGPSTGGLWRLVRDWSTDPIWTWPTSPADIGTSQVQVQIRDGFHESPFGWDDDASALFTVLQPNLPPKLLALTSDRPGPQYAGTPIRWTAIASDPDSDLVLYRFWLKGPSTGNAWRVVQDWSPVNQWIWADAPADTGAYTVYVYARDGRHSGPGGYDSALGAPYLLIAGNRPPVATALTPDKPSPQYAGAPIRWTATASDPDNDPLLYRFWLKGSTTGNAWKIVQDWSPLNKWTWASTPADIGDFSVYVYVRDGRHVGPAGYDSAVGKPYTLLNPMAARVITTGSALRDKPSLLFAGDGYALAYQSWELGQGNQGDVALQKLDPLWNKIKSVWASSSKAYEDSPSLAFAGGNYYLAYVSAEKGNRDIYVKKYDANLNPVETKQLTTSPTEQNSPSILAVGSDIFLAYQSWDSGPDSGGDIVLTRFDQQWNPLATVEVTDQKSYQDRPTLAFAGGNFYVAYTSRETGNLDIFLKRFDGNLNFLETKRMTTDSSDQDYPSLKWVNGQFMLLYATKKSGNYEIVLDRFLRDWKAIDSSVAVAAPGDQTASSMAFSPVDGMYWVAYASKDPAGQNIYVKPLKLSAPAGLKPCDIAVSFSATRANMPYTMTLRFYNSYGELTDPVDLSFIPPSDSARPSDRLQKVSIGTFQFSSIFGPAGDKSFRVGANIDGCISAKTATVKVV